MAASTNGSLGSIQPTNTGFKRVACKFKNLPNFAENMGLKNEKK